MEFAVRGVKERISGVAKQTPNKMVPLPVLLVASPSEKSDLFQPEARLHEYSEDSSPTTEQSTIH